MARHPDAFRESPAGLTAPAWLADDMVGRAITLAIYLAVESSCDATVVEPLLAAKAALIAASSRRAVRAGVLTRAEAAAAEAEVRA